MSVSRFVVALALALAWPGCDSGDSSQDGCHRDEDCASGRCIAGACVSLTNPLDASIPDMSETDSSRVD